jgi:hypothetical protein
MKKKIEQRIYFNCLGGLKFAETVPELVIWQIFRLNQHHALLQEILKISPYSFNLYAQYVRPDLATTEKLIKLKLFKWF